MKNDYDRKIPPGSVVSDIPDAKLIIDLMVSSSSYLNSHTTYGT